MDKFSSPGGLVILLALLPDLKWDLKSSLKRDLSRTLSLVILRSESDQTSIRVGQAQGLAHFGIELFFWRKRVLISSSESD